MEDRLSDNLTERKRVTLLLSIFAGLALVLAAVGIYGVMSQAVQQRTREMGIRIALGASPARILTLILGRATILCILGSAIGIAGSLALTRVLGKWLFGITPTDPFTFAGISVLNLIVVVASSYWPARRAASVAPMTVLRWE
jgi:putative ABC transport system permease protein